MTGWAVLTSILVCAGTRSLRRGWGHGKILNGFPVQAFLSSLWSGFLFSLWVPISSSLLWSDSALDLSALLSLILSSLLSLILSSLLCSTHTIDWLVDLARREPECLLGESAKSGGTPDLAAGVRLGEGLCGRSAGGTAPILSVRHGVSVYQVRAGKPSLRVGWLGLFWRSDPGWRCTAALRRGTQDHSALSFPEVSSRLAYSSLR